VKRLWCGGGLGFLMLLGIVGGTLWAENRPVQPNLSERYGYRVDLKRYPQGNPQETVRSIIEATAQGEIEYMLAHLIAPDETDQRLRGDRQLLHKLASKATPEKSGKMIEGLSRHLADGTWTIKRGLAWSHVDGVQDLSLQNLGDRWFMHNTPKKRP